MSQIAPEVGRYLQMRAQRWLDEDDKRSASDLASAADVSKERVSVLLRRAAIGFEIAEKIGAFFGFSDMSTLLPAAREWSRSAPPAPRVVQAAKLPRDQDERIALAVSLAEEDGASAQAVRAVLAEPAPDQSILRLALRIVRRDLELAEAALNAPASKSIKRLV